MIWSIIPEELIFAQQEPEQALTVITYLGKQLSIRNGRIDALLSTDPHDYLDQRFAPGSLIDRQ